MDQGTGSGVERALRATSGANRHRLRGWKEIGRHFGVDERTAKRWEATRGLPVHRVPGESRASVFAFVDELIAWEAGGRKEAVSPVVAAVNHEAGHPARRPWLAVSLILLVLCAGIALWLGMRVADERREAAARTTDATRLAAGQLAAMNDQLDSQPGTVAVREALAREAVRVLGDVAASARTPELRRDAAEGYRRLAVLQNAVDRPSLRDRAAARASLDRALALLANDQSAEAEEVRTLIRLEAARQAGGGGGVEAAEALLDAARPAALARPGSTPEQEWWLVRAEISSWAGDHAAALRAARRAQREGAESPPALLRELKARDLEAEALYYLGDLAGARSVYAAAVAQVQAAAERWPADRRLRWGLLRQQWNLGSTLVTAGEPKAAVPLLSQALAGWEELGEADPSDEAVAAWIRATRLSLGQALEAAGQPRAAVPVLSKVVAERRAWLAAKSGDADRRRMLMKGLSTLGDTLVRVGRTAEACLLYAEAERLGKVMTSDGQLTGFDQAETVRLLMASQARHCQEAV